MSGYRGGINSMTSLAVIFVIDRFIARRISMFGSHKSGGMIPLIAKALISVNSGLLGCTNNEYSPLHCTVGRRSPRLET